MNDLFMKRLDLAIGFSGANMMDVLDEKNDKGYWEGYRDALMEIREKILGELK